MRGSSWVNRRQAAECSRFRDFAGLAAIDASLDARLATTYCSGNQTILMSEPNIGVKHEQILGAPRQGRVAVATDGRRVRRRLDPGSDPLYGWPAHPQRVGDGVG